MLKKYLLSLFSIFALSLPISAANVEECKCDLLIKGYEFTNDGLSEAIIKNDKEAIELFVKAEININMPDTEGYSALDRAIKIQNKEAEILIAQAGGEAKKFLPEEESPKIGEETKPTVEVLEVVQEQTAKQNKKTKQTEETPLSKFCALVSSNNLEEVDKIAQTFEEINLLTEEGLAPLHYAIFNGNIEMVKLLLKHGADANVLADDSMTPLDITVLNNQQELAKIILENGGELSENVADELEKFGCTMKYDEELNLYQAVFEDIFAAMNKIQQKIDSEKK